MCGGARPAANSAEFEKPAAAAPAHGLAAAAGRSQPLPSPSTDQEAAAGAAGAARRRRTGPGAGLRVYRRRSSQKQAKTAKVAVFGAAVREAPPALAGGWGVSRQPQVAS